MKITQLVWTEDKIEHIVAKHNVDPLEVEETCFPSTPENRIRIEQVKSGQGKGQIGDVYFVLGRTEAGRYLTIVCRYAGRGKMKIITARDMDKAEKSRYRKR